VNNIIIAIDGYSSCGKSTFAKAIARELNYIFIDSGAMYRAATLDFLRNGVIRNGTIDVELMKQRLAKIVINFRLNETANRSETFLNNESVEDEIRGLEVSNHVSIVSAQKEVRAKLVKLQQEMGREKGIVMDGRDIGTTVFPMAELKIFMTADPKIRAKRRYDELVGKGQQVNIEEVEANIRQRDYIDETRDESPLRKAEDALVLDNSNMTPAQQMEWVRGIIAEQIENRTK
jgi:CMP/dCMP kinase